jgi:hypothetical protein
MKPFHIYLLIITFSLILATGSFFAGKHVGKEDCPPTMRIDTTILYDQPEIERLDRQILRIESESEFYEKKVDSLEYLLTKKNETKIVVIDSIIPAINRRWAEYHTR